VISTFKPFKSEGTDGIVTALLHQGVNHLTTHLCHIFTACLARGYIPKAWRQVKVTFIPKPGKANYTKAKAYCPISLSFMLKTMEKLVDRHIKDEILGLRPIHQYQFAYQPGKSTKTTLHHVITHIQEAVENREVTPGALLDIAGAFDSTSFDIITKTATCNRLGDAICQWIGYMLRGRKITATLAEETLEGSVARGCTQGGVVTLLTWSLVVDELIRGLNGKGCYTPGYADDIAILISEKFPNTVSELLQVALNMVQQ
jgi:hypothetical protein